MNQATAPAVYRCHSIGCNHNVPAGEDFCAECATLLKTTADKLAPLPLNQEERLMDQYIASVPADPVVEANRQLLLQRSQVGIRKYGTPLGGAGLSRRALLQHALEEALDLANYLQAELQRSTTEAA
jgi:hypothetical protein